MTSVIYLIRSPSGKGYVGQTVNYEERMKGHKKHSTNCTLLKYAIDKYGWNAMKVTILIKCANEYADQYEQDMIRAWDTLTPNGYNCVEGGNSNKRLSDETKKKISTSLKLGLAEGTIKYQKPADHENFHRAMDARKRKIRADPNFGSVRLTSEMTFRAFIPSSWSHRKEHQSIGTFKTREEGEYALKIFFENYVKDHETPLDSSNFCAPGKLSLGGAETRIQKGRANSNAGSVNKIIRKKHISFTAAIPRSWNIQNRPKRIGTFSSNDYAWNALKLYHELYVKNREIPLEIDYRFTPDGIILHSCESTANEKREEKESVQNRIVESEEQIDEGYILARNCAKSSEEQKNVELEMNNKDSRMRYANKSKGTVSFNKKAGKYKAIIPQSWTPGFVQKCIGMYDTEENAHTALKTYFASYVENKDIPMDGSGFTSMGKGTGEHKYNTSLQNERKQNAQGCAFKKRNKFLALIPASWAKQSNKKTYIGTFATKEEALDAIKVFKEKFIN